MAKFVLLFLAVAAAAWVFRELFSKRERKATWKATRSLVIPALIAIGAVIASLALSLSPTIKVI